MGTYAYDAANDSLSLVAGTGDTDAIAAKVTKTSNNIAPLQSSSTASELIPVGEYFINYNGDLCQCDVQINADSAIVIGTNCHVVQKGISNELGGEWTRTSDLNQFNRPSFATFITQHDVMLIPIQTNTSAILPTIYIPKNMFGANEAYLTTFKFNGNGSYATVTSATSNYEYTGLAGVAVYYK